MLLPLPVFVGNSSIEKITEKLQSAVEMKHFEKDASPSACHATGAGFLRSLFAVLHLV